MRNLSDSTQRATQARTNPSACIPGCILVSFFFLSLSPFLYLEIEFIESVERLIRVHVERVDVEVVGRHVERIEHLRQRQRLAVAHDHDLGALL